MNLLEKNNTPESIQCKNKIVENENNKEKEMIIYELGVDAESLEIPEPKLEEPMIQELTNSVVGETRETRERREIKEKEKPKKKVNFAEDKKVNK
jgi:hypothetical protein